MVTETAFCLTRCNNITCMIPISLAQVNVAVGVGVGGGWLKQPHMGESDWTLGLGEAPHLLQIW